MAKIFTDTDAPNTDAYKRWAICDGCEGEGKHSKGLGCISSEEMDDWSPEEKQDYFSGKYDRRCEDCGGSGKVRVPEAGAPFWVRRLWVQERQWAEACASYAQDVAYERRMLSGGY